MRVARAIAGLEAWSASTAVPLTGTPPVWLALMSHFGLPGDRMTLTKGVGLAMAGAEQQLFWMVLVSAPILLAMLPAFGPLVRALQPVHIMALLF